ncbi:MAG TPA: 4-hydroxybenzoate octaprenyltransferase [Pelagibacteraceae bacterium]|jgi:4-hydroxybenzoate polyprenyltransferase|nr:4-hydroxybenzoate octaprenyltransferase [Pelagibacteraceae bacterium]
MEKFQIFIQLTRLNKPIGFLLLFWPCVWGLTLAYYFSGETNLYLKHILLFFLGSVLMRSAGCIFNDIVDRDLDKKVQRTRERPIASGKVSVSEAFIYIVFLCLVAFLILLQFNWLTIVLGISSIVLAFAYPFMKRITYWPQLFLGLTFNWGIIMGWTSITNSISTEPVILYLAAIFWTLGYDTIYGLQDIHDDEIIGVKSTSIKFKNNVKIFVGTCYSMCVFLILIMFFTMEINKYLLLLIIPFIVSFVYQVKIFKVFNSESCLLAFKNNNLIGSLIFIFIFSFNIL